MSEANTWSFLKKARSLGRNLHMDRLENSVSGGMPDVEGCLYGSQFWLELKFCERPARASTHVKPKFRPGQVPWIEARHDAGGRAFVLLQVGRATERALYLVPAPYVRQLQDEGYPEQELARRSMMFRGKNDLDPHLVVMAAARVGSGPWGIAGDLFAEPPGLQRR